MIGQQLQMFEQKQGKKVLQVSEIFSSLQGEGPSTGQRATFLRLANCNLRCLWCDAAYTWRFHEKLLHNDGRVYDKKDEIGKYTLSEIKKSLGKLDDILVITGGEPMLQSLILRDLIFDLYNTAQFDRFEIETNGTIFDPAIGDYFCVQFNVSPKFRSSGNDRFSRFKPEVLKQFLDTGKSIFKFVVGKKTLWADIDDLLEIRDAVDIPNNLIWVMGEGITAEGQIEMMKELESICADYGWNLSPRLHILLWGNERGR